MNGAGTFFLILLILIIVGIAGWIGFTQFRARRLGLPPPSWKSYIPFLGSPEQSPYGPPQPRRGGAMGWIEDRIAEFRQKRDRNTTGAYEQGRALDPDDAWDTRVPGDQGYGHGGYYNETELEEGRGRTGQPQHLTPGRPYGAAADAGNYSGSGYQMNIPTPTDGDDDPPRGRSRSRGGDSASNPFGEGAVRQNPFGEVAEPSNMSGDLRGVSTRPMDNDGPSGKTQGEGNERGSPSRRSMFRENV